jgi:hypothetical protein
MEVVQDQVVTLLVDHFEQEEGEEANPEGVVLRCWGMSKEHHHPHHHPHHRQYMDQVWMLREEDQVAGHIPDHHRHRQHRRRLLQY